MAGIQSVPPLHDLPTNNYEPTDSSIGSQLFVGRRVTHTLALERTSNELDARSLLVQAHNRRRRQLFLFSYYLLVPEV